MKNYLLNNLFSFSQVVEAGSFTKAARELDISPSVLSKRICKLEAALGVCLIKRTTRTMSLTAEGQICCDEMTALKRGLDHTLEKIQSARKIPHGKLRISAPYSFGQLQLAPLLWEFMQRYPDIKIDLLLGLPTIRLLENNIDLGIFIKNIPDSRLIARRIGYRKIVICASPDYIKRYGMPISPASLQGHNCLLYQSANLHPKWHFRIDKKLAAVKVQGNFSANCSQLLMQAALEGGGIVKLPDYIVHKALQEKKLVSMLEEFCPQNIGIFAAYPFSRHPALNVRIFIDFLTKRLESQV